MNAPSSDPPRVICAQFRLADPEKDPEALPSPCTIENGLCALAMRVICTSVLCIHRGNALKWEKPELFLSLDKESGRGGTAPEYSYIRFFPTFFGNFYHLDDPIMIQALFAHFRGSNDVDDEGFLEPTSGMMGFANLIREICREEISDEDIMLVCSEGQSRAYRTWLHTFFLQNSRPLSDILCQEAEKMLTEWSKRGEIDLTEAVLFASRVTCRFMFGDEVSGDEVGRAIHFLNGYLIKKLGGRVSSEDQKVYESARKICCDFVNTAVVNLNTPLFQCERRCTLSTPQQKAMAVVVLFAAQENSGFLLSNLLLELAQKPDLQRELREELSRLDGEQNVQRRIGNLSCEMMQRRPPAYVVARRTRASSTVCLEYKLEGDARNHKVIMPGGSFLSARMNEAAKRVHLLPLSETNGRPYDAWSGFGGGKHSCPGRRVALLEVEEFLLHALKGYKLSTTWRGEPELIGEITLQFARPIAIQVTPLRSESS